MPNPLVTIPLSEDEQQRWKADIQRAEERRRVFEPGWEKNLKAYTPDPTNEKWGDEVNPGVDFYQTEQKKALLFFDTPTVILAPEPDTPPDQYTPILQHQTKLNRKLGRRGLNMKRVMDLVLFDILCPAGVGCVEVGLTQITKDVPLTDPTTGAPQMDENGDPMTAPVPVYRKIFADRFSPKKLLLPTNFHSTLFDESPWLGRRFAGPSKQIRREFQIPADIELKAKDPDKQIFNLPGLRQDETPDDEEITGTVIYYKAAFYDDAVYHPEWYRQLVFIDGMDEPVVHRDSPYQTFDPNTGEFTPDSMRGNPICPMVIRDLSDSAYIPSDSTMTRPLVNELSRFRTQLIELRDSSTSIRLANGDVITPEVMAKVVRGPFGSIITIAGADYNDPNPPIKEIAHPVYSRENFQSQSIIESDLSKINTLSANQLGTEQDTARTATELSYVQRNSNVRMQQERNRVVEAFLNVVAKIDALMKRFEPDEASGLSSYSYDIKPDSGVHVDAAEDRKFFTETYNMLAKDPNINRMELLKELLPLIRQDPTKLIVQPPPAGPPPPKSSLIIRGEDLSPLAPQYANTVQALGEMGIKLAQTPITPDLVENAAHQKPLKPHGGTPERPDLVSKHSADETQQIPNFGGQAGAA